MATRALVICIVAVETDVHENPIFQSTSKNSFLRPDEELLLSNYGGIFSPGQRLTIVEENLLSGFQDKRAVGRGDDEEVSVFPENNA